MQLIRGEAVGFPGRSLVFMGMSKELETLKLPSSGLGNPVILYCKPSQKGQEMRAAKRQVELKAPGARSDALEGGPGNSRATIGQRRSPEFRAGPLAGATWGGFPGPPLKIVCITVLEQAQT